MYGSESIEIFDACNIALLVFASRLLNDFLKSRVVEQAVFKVLIFVGKPLQHAHGFAVDCYRLAIAAQPGLIVAHLGLALALQGQDQIAGISELTAPRRNVS